MAPDALAERLLPEREHRPVVDAIINGRGGLTPPSESVDRVWLVERMVPFDATTCRSHVFNIGMGSSDPAAKPWAHALPTHPVKVEQYDRLWVPPSGSATIATCASAPARASGFGDGGLGLRQAAGLVEQARTAFRRADRSQAFTVSCRGENGICGTSPRQTLAAIDWSSLGLVEQIAPTGEHDSDGGPKSVAGKWGPAHVRFAFPYAAGGATWMITVDRAPIITAVRMEAASIVYE